MKKVLFIGAHVDDIELSCAGTIQKYIERGDMVFCLIMSYIVDGKKLIDECASSIEYLGVQQFDCKNFTVRKFNEHRQSILEYFHVIRNDFDIVYTHSASDIHQDHRVIGEESLRAFRNCDKLLTYTNPWNGINKKANCFSIISGYQLDQKIKALSCYQSQKERPYMNEECIWTIARSSGIQCGYGFAEEFEIVKLKF